MPRSKQHRADFAANETEQRLLECVREQHGLENIDQAAEFLLRRRLRLMARRNSGRRALNPVGGE